MSKTKDETPAEPATQARKGGALTKNPIQKAVNRMMAALGDLANPDPVRLQEDRERACRILGELLASERPPSNGGLQ